MIKSAPLLILLMFCCVCKIFAQVPVVSSLNPASGKVGTLVTIAGQNFDLSADDNIVHFGSTQAVIKIATPTQLTVEVPKGATNSPVSVINRSSKLTGYSRQPFMVTFQYKNTVTNEDFAAPQTYSTLENTTQTLTGDLNADGKNDILVVNHLNGVINVLRNTSSKGSINTKSFEFANYLVCNNVEKIKLADLNGDGKPEILALNNSNSVYVFVNNSQNDVIDFGIPLTLNTVGPINDIDVADADGDGKPDVIVGVFDYYSKTVCVFKNTFSNERLTFDERLEFTAGESVLALQMADMDGDGKPDVVTPNAILLNISDSGSINFITKRNYSGTSTFKVADMDNDGKPDIVSTDYSWTKVSVFKNTSTPGQVTVDPANDFPGISGASEIGVYDIDGDGKNDIFTVPGISLLHNNSAGSLSFESPVKITSYSFPFQSFAVADLDGDELPDIITIDYSNKVFIYHNNPKDVLAHNGPVITSISPANAPAGATLTINGSGFNGNASKNTVLFGASVATVSSSSATQLKVSLTSASTYKPVTVSNTDTHLTAYFNTPFVTTFNSKKGIYASDFAPEVRFTAQDYLSAIKAGDLNGDGKPEVVIANKASNTISVYKNASETGTISSKSLAAKLDLPAGSAPQGLNLVDLDGDGRAEIIACVSGRINIYPNTSSSGNISFATVINLEIGNSPDGCVIGDVDNDGKADLIVLEGFAINIFRNTSSSGTKEGLSFTLVKTLPSLYNAGIPQLADIDGDGKIDILFSENGRNSILTKFSVFRNTSVPGSVNFDAKVSVSTDYDAQGDVSTADIDGDGKQDVILTQSGSYSLYAIKLYRNSSQTGQISFENAVLFNVINPPRSVSVGDIDGDGKPDVLVPTDGKPGNIAVFRNKAVSGSISTSSLEPALNLTIGLSPLRSELADIDGDGKLDIIAEGANAFSIYRYNSNPLQAPPLITSFTPTTAGMDGVVTLNGSFFSNATAVSFGGVPATSFKVISPNTITAVVGPGASGDIVVRTLDGADSVKNFKYAPPPVITGFTPDNAGSGAVVTITGTGFENVTGVKFGNADAASFTVVSSTSIKATVGNGNSGNVLVTTNFGTGALGGFKYPAPQISIAAPPSFIAGAEITPLKVVNKGGFIPDGLYGKTSIMAGSGTIGKVDARGTEASFNYPWAIAADWKANLYVADLSNNVIRKITGNGDVTVLAGTGIAGSKDGVAGEATFNSPRGIAVDLNGNIYVSEFNSGLIRKITSNGGVSTLAGGKDFSSDGLGKQAGFIKPVALATDLLGNIYVAEQGYHSIRKINPLGAVTRIAGSGDSGYADGTGLAVKFNTPTGVAVDGYNNVYVVDYDNARIRKITADSIVTTWAGSGYWGNDNGIGTEARFADPASVAADGIGNVFVANVGSNTIRRIEPDRKVTTLAGNGKQGKANGISTEASFLLPYGITTDQNGNVYVADTYNQMIRKVRVVGYAITPALPVGLTLNENGTISGTPTEASALTEYTITAYNGSGQSSSVLKFAVELPVAPTIDSFTPAVAFEGTKVTITGTGFTGTTAVTFGGQPASSFEVKSATTITAVVGKGSTGVVNVTTPGGTATVNDFTFTGPTITSFTPAVAVPGSTVTISGSNFTGTTAVTFGGVPAASFSVNSPGSITAVLGNGASGSITVSTANGTALIPGFIKVSTLPPNITYNNPKAYTINVPVEPLNLVNTGGKIPDMAYAQASTFAGSGFMGSTDGISTAATFRDPYAIATDLNGNVYITDIQNQSIRKVTPDGVVSTFANKNALGVSDLGSGEPGLGYRQISGITTDAAGNIYVAMDYLNLIKKITPDGTVSVFAGNGTAGSVNGPGSLASFYAPQHLATDAEGNIYVADKFNNMIRKITPAGVVTTVAGNNLSGNTDGKGTEARFLSPVGIAVDASGNIYVGDTGNSLIRKITPDGEVKTLAGSGSSAFADGVGKAASFYLPQGLAVDATGNIYVADVLNNRVRKITPNGAVGTLAGSSVYGSRDGVGGEAGFLSPTGLALDGKGVLYVAENFANRIKKISLAGYSVNPALPAGLKFTNGTITGTPTKLTPPTNFTVTGYTESGSSSTTVNLSVVNFAPPVNNFTVSTTSVSCKGQNNGAINIIAAKKLNYTATLSGIINKTMIFNDNLTIGTLAPGTYNLCITVDIQPDYKQCYTLTIAEPKDLTVYATTNKTAGTVDIAMSGGSSYRVTLNESTYSTSSSTITLPLAKGSNKLMISTDKPCQGSFEQLINLSGNSTPYPNPFQDMVYINLGEEVVNKVEIKFYNVRNGLLAYSESFINQSGVIRLNTVNMPPGVYSLHLVINGKDTVYKVVKP